MQGSNQIQDWYAQLTKVSMDDKADLDVLLLDKKHPEDAIEAIEGIKKNLMQGLYKEDLLLLLLDCTKGDVPPLVQRHAIVDATHLCLIYDEQIARSRVIQEAILEMLSYHQDIVVTTLRKMYDLQKIIQRHDFQAEIQRSLIFHLAVVGKDSLRFFQ